MLNKKPHALHTVLETRFALEALAHLSSKPLERLLPVGDGHPVLVIPAFLTSDILTASLRHSLATLGYNPHPWKLGVNTGLHQHKLNALQHRLAAIVRQHGQKVTLVGWSLGGLYARALAALDPENVRQVVTLGSPFAIPDTDSSGVQSFVGRAFSLLNGSGEDPMLKQPELWQTTPTVPCSNIFTQRDGVVHWHYCVDEKRAQSENIRVPGSHVGLTHNPAVLYLLADRLKQPENAWRPFLARGWHEQRLFDNRTCATAIAMTDTTNPASPIPA